MSAPKSFEQVIAESEVLVSKPTTPLDTMMTPAMRNLRMLEQGIAMLPEWEQREVIDAVDSIKRLILRYGYSAELAVMIAATNISIKEGQ